MEDGPVDVEENELHMPLIKAQAGRDAAAKTNVLVASTEADVDARTKPHAN